MPRVTIGVARQRTITAQWPRVPSIGQRVGRLTPNKETNIGKTKIHQQAESAPSVNQSLNLCVKTSLKMDVTITYSKTVFDAKTHNQDNKKHCRMFLYSGSSK